MFSEISKITPGGLALVLPPIIIVITLLKVRPFRFKEYEAWRQCGLSNLVGAIWGTIAGFIFEWSNGDWFLVLLWAALGTGAANSAWFYTRSMPDLETKLSDFPGYVKVRFREIARGDLLGFR